MSRTGLLRKESLTGQIVLNLYPTEVSEEGGSLGGGIYAENYAENRMKVP